MFKLPCVVWGNVQIPVFFSSSGMGLSLKRRRSVGSSAPHSVHKRARVGTPDGSYGSNSGDIRERCSRAVLDLLVYAVHLDFMSGRPDAALSRLRALLYTCMHMYWLAFAVLNFCRGICGLVHLFVLPF